MPLARVAIRTQAHVACLEKRESVGRTGKWGGGVAVIACVE